LKASDSRSPARGEVLNPGGPNVARLAGLIKAYAPHDGSFELRIRGVHAIRRSQTYTELMHGVQQSAVCIVAQGENERDGGTGGL
jgi:hypothetical protein